MTRSAVVLLAVALVGCERDNMHQGARLRPMEPPVGSEVVFAGAPPVGTVPREAGPFEPAARPALTRATLARGRDLFDAYCAPCHSRDGSGDGIVVLHGFPPPPSLHDAGVASRDDSHYAGVIEHGFGTMPPYGSLVRAADEWAIIDYIRALQLSRHAPPEAVPPGALVREGQP